MTMRFGAHVSIGGRLAEAVDRAAAIGCETMQIFSGNPRGWQNIDFDAEACEEFKSRRRAEGIAPVVIHLPYLVNLGSPIERVRQHSIASVRGALIKAAQIDADYLVMHTGSHVNTTKESGLERIVAGLRDILKTDFNNAVLLLENTAGAGYTVGDVVEDIGAILAAVDFDPRLGLCLDTCHAWAAGYDLSSPAAVDRFLAAIDESVGLERLLVIHANDCRGARGSRSDRHENIGDGWIGLQGWRAILSRPSLADKPFIIETPRREPDADRRNLALLRRLRAEVENP